MTNEELECIERYLEDLTLYMDHVPVSKRLDILVQVKNDIVSSMEKHDQPVETILHSLGKELAVANRYLIQNGYPEGHKKKNRNPLKIFLTISSIFIIGGIITVLVLIKSLTPVFKIDEEAGTLELLGGKIVLEQNDDSFFATDLLKKYGNVKADVNVNGSVPSSGISTISLNSKNIDLALRPNNSNNIKYDCKSDIATTDYINTNNDQLNLKFNGNAKCLLYVPKEIKFIGEFSNGFINLRDMRQDITIRLHNGTISWKQDDQSIYKLIADIKSESIIGSDNKFSKGKFQYIADFAINFGKINLR